MHLLIIFLTTFAFAEPTTRSHTDSKPKKEFADTKDIKTDHDTILLVTHADSENDQGSSTREPSEKVVQFAHSKKIPVIFLQKEINEKFFFCEDKGPGKIYYSEAGEFGVPVNANRVLSIGGFSSACHAVTMADLIKHWSKKREKLEICQITPAIYDDVEAHTLPSAIKEKGLNVLKPKYKRTEVPFSEILDLFATDKERIEFLKGRVARYLQFIGNTDYRTVIQYRGKELTVQEGKGQPPFQLVFRFVHPKPGEKLNLDDCTN